MSEDDVAYTLRHSGRQVSVDAPFSQSEDSKSSLLDVMPNKEQSAPDTSLMGESLRAEIESVLSTLSDKEATVIKLYFGFNTEYTATLEEIGEILSLTRERVRQIKEQALRKLRHASRSKRLKVYLG